MDNKVIKVSIEEKISVCESNKLRLNEWEVLFTTSIKKYFKKNLTLTHSYRYVLDRMYDKAKERK